jgi:hypothetical protein
MQRVRAIFTAWILVAALASLSAKAATQDFDDEAAFLTAAGSLALESFESTPVTNSLSLTEVATSDILVTSPDSGTDLGVFDLPDFGGVHATDGTNYLAFQSGTNERLVLDFADDINAVGINILDWGDFGQGELTFSNDAGDFFVVDVSPNPNGDEQFFGVINDGMLFNRVEFNQTISGEGYGVDEIYYGLTNEPPDCDAASAEPTELWPPDHKFEDVSVVGVTDPDGDPVTITITGIAQDEPLEGLGDGDTCPDADGVGTGIASVRAERSGTKKTPGDGRVYHIGFTADDGQGGSCDGVVTVCVPHDQRQGHVCVDQGPIFDSTVCGSP